MKNSNLLITASMFVFGACAQTGVINQIDEPEELIGFNAGFVDNITKSVSNPDQGEKGGTMEREGNTFQVWGWKTAGTNTTQVFNKQVVTYNPSSTQSTTHWEYSPLKYWDRKASYEFYAASPISKFEIDETDKTFTATNVPGIQVLYAPFSNPQVTADNTTAFDYLVANKVLCNAGKTNQGNATDKDVAFTFSHILSRLEIKVATTSNLARSESVDPHPQLVLKELDLYFEGYCEKYKQNEAGVVSSDNDAWSNPHNQALTTIPADDADPTRVCYQDETGIRLSPNMVSLSTYLISPTATDADVPNKFYIRAKYDIIYYEPNSSNVESTESFVSDITEVLKLSDGADASSTNPDDYEPALPKFKQGYAYTLNVTIAPSAIYFDVLSVEGYTTDTAADVTAE